MKANTRQYQEAKYCKQSGWQNPQQLLFVATRKQVVAQIADHNLGVGQDPDIQVIVCDGHWDRQQHKQVCYLEGAYRNAENNHDKGLKEWEIDDFIQQKKTNCNSISDTEFQEIKLELELKQFVIFSGCSRCNNRLELRVCFLNAQLLIVRCHIGNVS